MPEASATLKVIRGDGSLIQETQFTFQINVPAAESGDPESGSAAEEDDESEDSEAASEETEDTTSTPEENTDSDDSQVGLESYQSVFEFDLPKKFSKTLPKEEEETYPLELL